MLPKLSSPVIKPKNVFLEVYACLGKHGNSVQVAPRRAYAEFG